VAIAVDTLDSSHTLDLIAGTVIDDVATVSGLVKSTGGARSLDCGGIYTPVAPITGTVIDDVATVSGPVKATGGPPITDTVIDDIAVSVTDAIDIVTDHITKENVKVAACNTRAWIGR
jgi:hypothetical protein